MLFCLVVLGKIAVLSEALDILMSLRIGLKVYDYVLIFGNQSFRYRVRRLQLLFGIIGNLMCLVFGRLFVLA